MTRLDWDKAQRDQARAAASFDRRGVRPLTSGSRAPTAKQLALLARLGVDDPPRSRNGASELIDRLLRERRRM